MRKSVTMLNDGDKLKVYFSYHHWERKCQWSFDLDTTVKETPQTFISPEVISNINEVLTKLNAKEWEFDEKGNLVERTVVSFVKPKDN